MLGSISSRFVRPRSVTHTRRMNSDSIKRLEIEPKGPFTMAIFVALKLQLQYRTCKPAAISAQF